MTTEDHLLPDRPRRRGRQERAGSTVEAVIAAAVDILDSHGPDGLTVAEITARTGVSHGAVYHHFGDRDGVVRAAQFARLVRQPGRDIDALRAGIAASAGLDDFAPLVAVLARDLTDPERARIRLVRAGVIASADRDPELSKALTALESRVAADLIDVLSEGQRRGLVDAGLDAAAIAAVLESVSFGLLLLEHIEQRPSPEALAAALEQVFRALLPQTT